MTTTVTEGADDFESSTGSSSATTTEYKYVQLKVPSFQIAAPPVAFEGATTKTTLAGNSFIRLGSFPVTITASGSTYTMDTTGDEPDGFDTSLTLAKLVGNMQSTETTSVTIDGVTSAVTTSLDTVVSVESTADAIHISQGTGVIDTNPYNGDPDGLLGFADDTRLDEYDDASSASTSSSHLYVHADTMPIPNTRANRRAESSRLLSKGGWWDHADGNRVTTTAGDKVEVIQGNYKLVVLGRRNPSSEMVGEADITDSSGGHQASKTYEYTEVDGKEIWTVTDVSSWKYSYKEVNGYDISAFKGKKQVKIVGEAPESITSEARGTDVNWGALKDISPGDNDPSILTKTWAKEIIGYVGSANKPVPHSFSVSYIHAQEAIQIGSSSVKVTTLVGDNTSVSVYGVGLSTTSCLLDVSIKTMPVSVSVSAVGQAYEAKFGYSLSLHGATTGVFYQKTEVKAAAVDIGAVATQLYSTVTKLANLKTELTTQVTELSARSTTMSAEIGIMAFQHNHIAVVHNLL